MNNTFKISMQKYYKSFRSEVQKVGKWIIGAAWPYANYVPHLGNLIGSVLSADIAARYLRMKGEEVVFVSGSDEHGTPIEVEAIKRGIKPKELTDRMHEIIKSLFEKWEISFDNYTRTESEIHKEFVRYIMRRIYDNGYVFTQDVEMPYCPKDKIFLPDRFIRGKCPYCGFEDARGDQCDNCGRLLEPWQLIEPRCAICGSRPEWRSTRHWYFDLPKLQEKIEEYIRSNENLPENARNMSLNILKEGLKPRAITRDNKWGIPAPFPGAEGKTIYVWFDAVLGYISATKEYFVKKGEESRWEEFWRDPETKVVFFIGKDNIPFHTIIFPALILASGENFTLPYTVASTEYLLFEGKKFSKSRRIGIWIDEALELLPVDYWRFILAYLRPETKDTSFTWEEAKNAINAQLADNIGNYVHRVLSLIKKHFNGRVPPADAEPDERDKEMLNKLFTVFEEVDKLMSEFRIRMALLKILELAKEGNRYLNDKKPWELARKDKSKAATTLHIAARVVKALAILLAPYVPKIAQEIWRQLGYKDDVTKRRWVDAIADIEAGLELGEVKPIVKKLRDSDIEAMKRRLEEIREKGLVPSASQS